MRTFFTILFFSVSFGAFAQTNATASLLLSQIGKALDKHQVAATAQEGEANIWEWRFLMTEANIKGELEATAAKNLTSFTFTYNQPERHYRGEIQGAKKGVGQLETLAMIFFQLQQNIIQFGNNLDVMDLGGKRYYLLYFPEREAK